MTELYLHQLWQLKRFPFHRLKTITNQSIQVLEVGAYNTGSGPDFFNGRIIIDGVQLIGNIEMHLKSSDWYLHKHHLDPAYNNVILHVVLVHDKPVMINGMEIPTLELGEEINWLGNSMPVINHLGISCANQIAVSKRVQQQLNIVLLQRLERKAKRFKTAEHPLQAFFESFVEAFGRKVNTLPFLALAQKIRIELLVRLNSEQKKVLILGCSGFMENAIANNQKVEWNFLSICHNIEALNKVMWQTKGNRPASFPDKRLLQLAEIVSRVDWFLPFWEKPSEDIIAYWQNIIQAENSDHGVSDEFTSHLIINSVVPYLFFLAGNQQNSVLFEKALEVMGSLKSEKNTIVSTFSKLGIRSKNAKDSQALIELKQQWCGPNKCLTCLVGRELLGTENEVY